MVAYSPAGVIALLPLLERPMAEVAADLEVTSLTQHSLAFERVVGAALDTRAGGHWAACAITWLKDGFPVAGHTDALRRIITEKKRLIGVRARQRLGSLPPRASRAEPEHERGANWLRDEEAEATRATSVPEPARNQWHRAVPSALEKPA